MSLAERNRTSMHAAGKPLLLLCLLLASACTVKPLYSNSAALGAGAGMSETLASVGIKPVSTRYAQEVRNHLIFLFGGGRGEPAAPVYTLTLTITEINEATAIVQVNDEDEPTAGAIVMTGSYSLEKAGVKISSGTREISSSYDAPRQEFANLRAQRDAENRAARELAELIRLAIAQDLERIAG
jgi:LPS-assembly lipoprotein